MTAALLEHAQLIYAVQDGKVTDVDRLIKSGVNTDAKDEVRAKCWVGGRG